MVLRAPKSLTGRSLAVAAALGIAVAALFGLLVAAMLAQRDAGRSALRAQQAVTAGADLQRTVLSLENSLRAYVATGNRELLGPFEAARRDYPGQIAALERRTAGDGRQARQARTIADEVRDYVGLWALPLLDLARDDLPVARSVIGNAEGRRRVAAVRAAFAALSRSTRADAASTRATAERRSDLALWLGVAAVPLLLALVALGAGALRRGIVRPVGRLARATADVAAGDLSVRVADGRGDELGDLARAFNTMTAALEASQAELTHKAAALQHSNRELQDYASVTSHDLQGPLVTIGMYADLLVARHGSEPNARLLAERIRDSASGMRRLVRELLEYARLERDPGSATTVELADAVQDVLADLAGPIKAAGARVEVGRLPAVCGDPARITQLLQNLVTNAMKFVEEGAPEITVSAVRDGDTVTVTVRDNGIGFRAGQAEEIFRPFHRLHSTDRFEGTGIGLAVCHKIVDQHGGRIWAEGRPGEGAAFSFTLPADRTAPRLRIDVSGRTAALESR